MRRGSRFTHDMLLLMAGPMVWGVHFLLVYGLVGWLCARPALAAGWLGPAAATWAVLLPGLAAAALLAACARVQPASPDPADRRFLRRISLGLIALALLAIAWETLAVAFIPSCQAA